ncbi:hypothetical protein PG994_010247 [Apiospora phragmitis]|uniref:Uncharacterized protein n=1 Tax=Apiospora phragmitis TaxID=2905665 RepID=A0ABR1TPX6_9PEZI
MATSMTAQVAAPPPLLPPQYRALGFMSEPEVMTGGGGVVPRRKPSGSGSENAGDNAGAAARGAGRGGRAVTGLSADSDSRGDVMGRSSLSQRGRDTDSLRGLSRRADSNGNRRGDLRGRRGSLSHSGRDADSFSGNKAEASGDRHANGHKCQDDSEEDRGAARN